MGHVHGKEDDSHLADTVVVKSRLFADPTTAFMASS